jgi:hypothetical protein
MIVHDEMDAVEVANRWLENEKVHASHGFGTEMISLRVGSVVERIIYGNEITACGDGDPSRIDLAVVGSGWRGLPHNRLPTPTMAVPGACGLGELWPVSSVYSEQFELRSSSFDLVKTR